MPPESGIRSGSCQDSTPLSCLKNTVNKYFIGKEKQRFLTLNYLSLTQNFILLQPSEWVLHNNYIDDFFSKYFEISPKYLIFHKKKLSVGIK